MATKTQQAITELDTLVKQNGALIETMQKMVPCNKTNTDEAVSTIKAIMAEIYV